MQSERYLEIDGVKVFKEDIQNMNKDELSLLCSFLDKEGDLRFVQSYCREEYSYLIDNILFKIK